MWYNAQAVREGWLAHPFFSLKTSKNLKKTEKSFKKGIDKREKKWYNMQAVVRTANEDHKRFAERAV